MHFGFDSNTPQLPNTQSKTQRALVMGGIFIVVLILGVTVFNLFFNNDSKVQAFDRAIQRQMVVSHISKLASQYSDSSSVDTVAATANAVGVSNGSALSDIKQQLFGIRYTGEQPNLSKYQQELITANQQGNENEVARDLMLRATQSAINELQTLETEVSSPDHKESIRQLRENMSVLAESIDS